MPDKTRDEAEKQALKNSKLALGEVSEEGTSGEQKIDKAIDQTTPAGTNATPGSRVAITIGKVSDGEWDAIAPCTNRVDEVKGEN